MFSDRIKQEVKRKAAFRCCRCHEIGIAIHHIIPESQDGLDDIDNAAPLCQNCHDRYGNNPSKRTEIKQMRDFWYEVVEEKYHNAKELEILSELDQRISQYHQEDKQKLESIVKTLEKLSDISRPNLKDSKEVSKHKITTIIDFGSPLDGLSYMSSRRIRYSCPFCSKDLTLELEADRPGITFDTPVHLNPSVYTGMEGNTETQVTCPYCGKLFNLKNAK